MKRLRLTLVLLFSFGLIHGDLINLIQVNMTEVGSTSPLSDQLKSPQLSIDTNTDVLPDNNTWRDYPEDEDNNGFYDHLIVELGWINFTDDFGGIYGILMDKNENLLGTSQKSRYDSGNIVSLSFMGQPINAGGTDGPYVIWVGIFYYIGWWSISEVNFTHQYLTTTPYNHTEFERPSATIVGFSDYLADTNENQRYDEIIFNLSVAVKDPGHYEIDMFLEDSSPFSGSNNDFTAHWSGFLTPTEEEVEVSYSLHDYISWNLNGPYNVSYVQLRFYSQNHQFLTNPYSTAPYSINEFEPSQVKLTGRFFDWGVDLDSDGIYEEIAISVEVNVTRNRGLYNFDMDFNPHDTDQTDWDQRVEIEEHLPIGIQNVTFFSDATSFYSLKKNTSFIISYFWILGPLGNSQTWRGSLYTTRVYSYKEFNPPPAFLTGNNWDYLVDNNTDGIFEKLVIEVEINVTQTGLPEMEMRINLVPFGIDDSDLNLWRDYSDYLLKGIQVIPFFFNTREEAFFQIRQNTSYILKRIILREADGNMMDFAENSYITQNYSYKIFPPPRAFFTGKYSDRGIDLDNNNLFEELTFTVEINVTQTSQYMVRLAISSVDLDRNSWEEWVESPLQFYLNTEKHNITLSFDAASLYTIRNDTSFLVKYIQILDSDWNTLDWVDSPYNTRVYHYKEFQHPIVFFTGHYWDFGDDTDNDGMFNFLDVLVEVNASQGGHFSFDFNIRTYIPVWDSHIGETIDLFLNEGVQNVSHQFYVTLPYSLRLDTAYIFDDLSIRDTEGNDIDRVRQPHLTRVYQYEEFDPPSAILTGKSWDHGVDTDLDGTFDALSVIFEVNVFQTDLYSYDFHWYESEWQLHGDGSISVYWEEGLNNLSILVYSGPLYLLDRDSHHIVENIEIYDHRGHLQDRTLYNYITQSYSYLEFDRPGAILIGEFWDDGINLDSDSKYEEILISVGVDVIQQGKYTLRLELSVDNPEYKEFAFSVQDFWEEGFNDIYVYVPSSAFYSNDDSSFSLQIKLVQLFEGDNDLIHQEYYPYSTREYHHSDFDLFNNPATTATSAVGNPDWRIPFGLFLLVSISLVLFLSHKWRKPSSP